MLTLEGVEQAHRLLVPARVSTHPAAIKQGMASSARDVRLLVDTGASTSLVDENILRAIGQSIGVADVGSSVAGRVDRHVYRVWLALELVDTLGATVLWERPLNAIAAPPIAPAHQGILGMDVLRAFRLLYDGPQRTFKLMTD